MTVYMISIGHPRLSEVLGWLSLRGISSTRQTNRVQFNIPHGRVYTEFALRFADCSRPIREDVELGSGFPYNFC